MAIAFVRYNGTQSGFPSSGTTFSFSPTTGASVGDTVILFIGYYNTNSGVISAVSDNAGGNTWSVDATKYITTPSTIGIAVASCTLTTALTNSTTITVTTGATSWAASSEWVVLLNEFSGIASGVRLDTQGTTSVSSGTSISPQLNASTTNPGDLLYTALYSANTLGAFTGPSGYTALTQSTAAGNSEEFYDLPGSTSQFSSMISWVNSDPAVAAIVAYLPTSTASDEPQTSIGPPPALASALPPIGPPPVSSLIIGQPVSYDVGYAPGISHIQDAVVSTLNATSPTTSTFQVPTTVGNWLVACATTNDATGTSISGGGVGTWIKACASDGANAINQSCDIWYGQVTSTGQTVVTVTDIGGNEYPAVIVSEFHGINPINPVVFAQAANDTASGSATITCAAFPCLPGQLYFGGGYTYSGVPSPYTSNSGFTLAGTSVASPGGNAFDLASWQIIPSAGNYQLTYNVSGSGPFAAGAVVFNPLGTPLTESAKDYGTDEVVQTPPPVLASAFPPIAPPPVTSLIVGQPIQYDNGTAISGSGIGSVTLIANATGVPSFVETIAQQPPPALVNSLPPIAPPPITSLIVGQPIHYDNGNALSGGPCSGSLSLTATASGTPSISGTPTATISLLASEGANEPIDFVTGSISLLANAAGVPSIPGTASASITLGGTASGVLGYPGTGSASISLYGSGHEPGGGSATISLIGTLSPQINGNVSTEIELNANAVNGVIVEYIPIQNTINGPIFPFPDMVGNIESDTLDVSKDIIRTNALLHPDPEVVGP